MLEGVSCYALRMRTIFVCLATILLSSNLCVGADKTRIGEGNSTAIAIAGKSQMVASHSKC